MPNLAVLKSRSHVQSFVFLTATFGFGDLGGYMALAEWAALWVRPAARILCIPLKHYPLFCLQGSSGTLHMLL